MASCTKKAFTLAEIMIVFVVVGVLTAILIPTLFTATPDQDALRAKKAFNTLTRAVESLVNSGPYEVNGGLLDSTPFVSGNESADKNARNRFFCNNLAEVLNVSNVDCSIDGLNSIITSSGCSTGAEFTVKDNDNVKAICVEKDTQKDSLKYADLAAKFDEPCETYFSNKDVNSNFKTQDGTSWAIQLTNFSNNATASVEGLVVPTFYNLVCFNVGKSGNTQTVYSLGVRKDGKIVAGEKLQELLDKDTSKDED